MRDASFHILRPEAVTSAVVFASPHSGRIYPDAFRWSSVLDARQIRSSEDAYVDRLAASVSNHGAPLLLADAPRAYVDLNRAPEELDPALIRGVPRGALNPRISSGLGVIPRVVANGRAIYRGKIPREEADRRIEMVWRPYHQALRTLLEDAFAAFGRSILIDLHSMPHEAIDAVTQLGQPASQIVLGDRFGAACAPEIVDEVHALFEGEGFRVARNTPFAGAYVTQAYGRPSRGRHALQIEIDRALYLDEVQIKPHEGFEAFRTVIARILGQIAQIGVAPTALAAE